MHFYKLRDAANAIGEQLQPHAVEARSAVAEQYWHVLYAELCAGKIIGRELGTRLPIDLARIGSFIALAGCCISYQELQDWLHTLGVGVEIQPVGEFAGQIIPNNSPSKALPSSAQLARLVAPFLGGSRTDACAWLNRRLNEAKDYEKVKKYRRMEPSHGREIARWEVGGVVLYLIEIGEITVEKSRAFLSEHYPQHLSLIDHLPSNMPAVTPPSPFPLSQPR